MNWLFEEKPEDSDNEYVIGALDEPSVDEEKISDSSYLCCKKTVENKELRRAESSRAEPREKSERK